MYHIYFAVFCEFHNEISIRMSEYFTIFIPDVRIHVKIIKSIINKMNQTNQNENIVLLMNLSQDVK